MPEENGSLEPIDLLRNDLLSNPELDLSWHAFANCKGSDPDLFFPTRGASVRAAKAICKECQVREECLEHSVVHPEKFGIWGEMSERGRIVIRQERAREHELERAKA